MRLICIVDVQGFIFGDEFFPRELAMYDGKNQDCYEIYCNFDEDFIKRNKSQLLYQQYKIHGIPPTNVLEYRSLNTLKEEEWKQHLLFMYSIRKSKYHCYFGIKNIHLAKILDEINIPYIKLEDIEIENDKVPSLHTFDELNLEIEYTCALHSKICGRNYYPTD